MAIDHSTQQQQQQQRDPPIHILLRAHSVASIHGHTTPHEPPLLPCRRRTRCLPLELIAGRQRQAGTAHELGLTSCCCCTRWTSASSFTGTRPAPTRSVQFWRIDPVASTSTVQQYVQGFTHYYSHRIRRTDLSVSVLASSQDFV